MTRGRPRDPSIDTAVLAVTREHLAREGYEAMSVAAVAAAAGTTRQAIYRRWPSKADLATAAIASLTDTTATRTTDDPFADLVAELVDFQRGVSRPDGISMVGTMLRDATDHELVALYRARVVKPRRTRLRQILMRAQAAGLLDPESDLDVAVAMLTGSWYARALAGESVPRHWARRAAALVWRALGGRAG